MFGSMGAAIRLLPDVFTLACLHTPRTDIQQSEWGNRLSRSAPPPLDHEQLMDTGHAIHGLLFMVSL